MNNFIISNVEKLKKYEDAKNLLTIRTYGKDHLDTLPDIPQIHLGDIGFVVSAVLSDAWICNITYNLLNSWGLSKDELFDNTFENAKVISPIAYKELSTTSLDLEDINSDQAIFPNDDHFMYAVTNNKMLLGASAFFYPGIYLDKQFRPIHKARFFVIPSSIHEVLLVHIPDVINLNADAKIIEDMINDINRSEVVKSGDILSDHLFLYDGYCGYFGEARSILTSNI